MKNLQEKKGDGAIPINRFHRWFHRNFKRIKLIPLGKGIGFDWTTGYDVRDVIGTITIKNQGTNSSCGGQAQAYALEISRRLQGIEEGAISADSMYAPIAYPGGGTTVPALTTQFCTRGGNLESTVPSYDAYGNPNSEIMAEDLSWYTPKMKADAFIRSGYTPLDVKITMDEIATSIQNYGFIIWEIRGQVNGTWASKYPLPPQKGGTGEFFSHFMCIIGARMINGVQTLIALESEGIYQGDQGIQYFTSNYVNSPYIIDCFTFVRDSQIKSLPPTMGVWNSLLQWFKSLKSATLN